MPSASSNPLTKKAGPAPVWVWLVVALVGYYVYTHYISGSAATSSQSPAASVGTGTNSGDTTSAPASGQGAAVDNVSADLLSQMTNGLVGVNTNLVSALENANNNIVGLGSEALQQNGQLEQAIIQSYVPQQQVAPVINMTVDSSGNVIHSTPAPQAAGTTVSASGYVSPTVTPTATPIVTPTATPGPGTSAIGSPAPGGGVYGGIKWVPGAFTASYAGETTSKRAE